MKTLFDVSKLGTLTLKNRFIRSSIGEKTADGAVNEEMISIYRKLAAGGVGSILTGFTLVDSAEKSFPMLAFYDDSFAAGHRRLVDTIHEHNVNVLLQLVYVGSYVMGNADGMIVLAPSAVQNLNTGITPKEITTGEIKNIQQNFAKAALRAKNAGYDGIEIHAAHGFLLSQFMTPYYNQRSDMYGGSVENRARMTLETYKTIRQAVGSDFQIWVKINVNDGIEGGVSMADCVYLCGELSKAGVNAIEISGSWFHLPASSTSYFKNEAMKIAEANNVAVIMTGGNRDAEEMTAILNNSKISYFGMARPFMSEPDIVNRFINESK